MEPETETRTQLIVRLDRLSGDPRLSKADRRRAREDVERLQQQVRDEWAARSKS